MNTLLMQAGYTPAIIPVEDKKRYLEALQSADDGTYQPLHGMLEESVSKSMRLLVEVVEGRDAFDYDDLARMVRNIAEQTRAIEQELGPATIPPEQRASQTASKIRQNIVGLLTQHAEKVTTPNLSVRVNPQGQQVTFSRLQQFRNNYPDTGQMMELTVGPANKRFVPSLVINFLASSGRMQVGVAGFVRLGRYDSQLREVIDVDPVVAQLSGPIYFEDWDLNEISAFVLKILKDAYLIWTTEMDRRKSIIAAQELEASKFRPRRE